MITNFNADWQFSSDQGKTWVNVTLPHDAQMTLQRSKEAAGGSATGFFPGGDFIYRKAFDLSAEEAAGHITFHFGGVYKHAAVLINGKEAGGCCYGYLPFDITADGLVKEGGNTIEVSCTNKEQPDSRWYSGAGIYRSVLIETQGKERILPGTVRIRTMSYDPESRKAVLHIEAGTEPESAREKLKIAVFYDNNVTAGTEGSAATEAGNNRQGKTAAVAKMTGTGFLDIPDAKLWSAEEPNLYRIVISLPGDNTKVSVGDKMQSNQNTAADPTKNHDIGREADRAEVVYGIRQITTNPDGVFVNGQRVLLRGGCIHSDNGILGAREYKESAYRRIRLLKQYGYNAIRSAHNPISEELLDACDHLGMYIMDETWDMWYRKKSKYDYANDFPVHYRDDITAVVKKDFNHPSVILYSIGNEVSEPAEPKGRSLGREMTELFHQLDPSRPVTGGFNLMIITQSAKGKGIYDDDGGRKSDDGEKKMGGMNSTMFNLITSMVGTGMNKAANGKKADEVTSPILDAVDIAGYNYASGRYKNERKLHPARLVVGSETFPQDIAKNWDMIGKYPWVVGDFMWTSWDYLGEAGIGTWSVSPDAKGFAKPYPWLLADAGALDITGAPNGEAFLADSVWTGKTFLAVRPVNEDPHKLIKGTWRGTNAIPSWSFAGCEGKKAVAEVYTGAPFAELYLNGQKAGRKKVKGHRAIFKLTYEPGELKAVGVDENGNPWKAPAGSENVANDPDEKGSFAESVLTSAGKDLKIGVHAEKPETDRNVAVSCGSGEVVYLTVQIEDGKGIAESNAERKLRLSAEGAELLGFGSAEPRTEERFDSGEHRTWRGRAQAVIRVPENVVSGTRIVIRAEDITGDGKTLPAGEAELIVR